MAYFVFLLIPILIYIVSAILMARRFYHQADTAGVDPEKAISAAGFGLTALITGFMLWELLSATGKTAHVISVTGAVMAGLITQWVISKWLIPDPPSDVVPPSDLSGSP